MDPRYPPPPPRAWLVRLLIILGLLASAGFLVIWAALSRSSYFEISFVEPEFEKIDPKEAKEEIESTFPYFIGWQRPPGPPKVGLQVGHLKSNELPDELSRIRERRNGASGGGKQEWEVNLAIAQATAAILEKEGILVDILPSTVPPDYFADVFLAIHADGSRDPNASGFKVAAPWWDLTGKAASLVKLLEEEYAQTTNLKLDNNVTENMRGYYAFNWWKYQHAVHPMSVAVIVETGFLTSLRDQQIIIKNPQRAAQGIAKGIVKFLSQGLTLLPVQVDQNISY